MAVQTAIPGLEIVTSPPCGVIAQSTETPLPLQSPLGANRDRWHARRCYSQEPCGRNQTRPGSDTCAKRHSLFSWGHLVRLDTSSSHVLLLGALSLTGRPCVLSAGRGHSFSWKGRKPKTKQQLNPISEQPWPASPCGVLSFQIKTRES